MANFAVIEEGKVINIILCDSKEIAEEITGKVCIEYTNENPAIIGLGYNGVLFEQIPVEETDEESLIIR